MLPLGPCFLFYYFFLIFFLSFRVFFQLGGADPGAGVLGCLLALNFTPSSAVPPHSPPPPAPAPQGFCGAHQHFCLGALYPQPALPSSWLPRPRPPPFSFSHVSSLPWAPTRSRSALHCTAQSGLSSLTGEVQEGAGLSRGGLDFVFPSPQEGQPQDRDGRHCPSEGSHSPTPLSHPWSHD